MNQMKVCICLGILIVMTIVLSPSTANASNCDCGSIRANYSTIPGACGSKYHVLRGQQSMEGHSCATNTEACGTCDFTATWKEYSCCHYLKCSKDLKINYSNCTGTSGNNYAQSNCGG